MAFRFRGSFSRTDQTARLEAWPVGPNQTIAKGDLLALASGRAVLAAPGATNVLGVAAHPITTGATPGEHDVVLVYIDPEAIFEVDYVGASKTSLTLDDLGAAFNITATADAINLDDTTNGMCIVVGFDNDAQTAKVKIAAASRALH